ncbi:MAG: AMP-dependent synthetase/ligase [Sulfuricurvum sp.]|nr:AMP-dependent synthetase/ligase [Sulfuricurvum sp.]MDP3021733.1 AMP-dependent synthetase/ligase [Sulfuricurvum sp.]
MFSFNTFPELLEYIKTSINNPTYLSYLHNGEWQSFSSQAFVTHTEKLAAAFAYYGVTKGTSVAIISGSSPFWLMIDFALQRLGATSVPIFANISRENLHYEIKDSAIEYVFIASQEKYDQLAESLKSMKLVVTLGIESNLKNVIEFDAFLKTSYELPRVNIAHDDVATIIYTSGSTGKPKGVELTHNNLMSQIKDVRLAIPITSDEIALSFLPLAHIFERMVVLYYLANGICIYFADDVKNVGNLMNEVRPTVMTVVPRLLEKIYTKMHDKIYAVSGIKGLIGQGALHRANTKEVHTPLNSLDKLAHRLVYAKLLEALGGRMQYMISGGAALSPAMERFFVNIGIPLYQGYGLSETSPVVCVNTPHAYRFGSCGKKLSSIEVKLSLEGELLVKGPNVMRGYHNLSDETRKTIDNGWLHTGDLAYIDDEGYIFIKSRLKELFKTSTGKYVSAIAIEHHLTHSKWVDYAIIVAENRPYVTALIFLDPSMSMEPFEKYHREIKTAEKMEQLIQHINQHLNAWEQIQKYTLIPILPTIDNHMLTPSMKISRNTVYACFSDEIEAMYHIQSTNFGE